MTFDSLWPAFMISSNSFRRAWNFSQKCCLCHTGNLSLDKEFQISRCFSCVRKYLMHAWHWLLQISVRETPYVFWVMQTNKNFNNSKCDLQHVLNIIWTNEECSPIKKSNMLPNSFPSISNLLFPNTFGSLFTQLNISSNPSFHIFLFAPSNKISTFVWSFSSVHVILLFFNDSLSCDTKSMHTRVSAHEGSCQKYPEQYIFTQRNCCAFTRCQKYLSNPRAKRYCKGYFWYDPRVQKLSHACSSILPLLHVVILSLFSVFFRCAVWSNLF